MHRPFTEKSTVPFKIGLGVCDISVMNTEVAGRINSCLETRQRSQHAATKAPLRAQLRGNKRALLRLTLALFGSAATVGSPLLWYCMGWYSASGVFCKLNCYCIQYISSATCQHASEARNMPARRIACPLCYGQIKEDLAGLKTF